MSLIDRFSRDRSVIAFDSELARLCLPDYELERAKKDVERLAALPFVTKDDIDKSVASLSNNNHREVATSPTIIIDSLSHLDEETVSRKIKNSTMFGTYHRPPILEDEPDKEASGNTKLPEWQKIGRRKGRSRPSKKS